MKLLQLLAALMLIGCATVGAVLAADTPTTDKAKTEKPATDVGKDDDKAPDLATIDKKAPAFTLKDANGKEHKLSDYAGKIVVLEWTNFDCPFVKKHYVKGDMPALAKKYRDKDVVWLLICSSAEGKQGHFEGKTLTDRLAKEAVDAGHYLIDDKSTVGRAYQAKATPHMFIIDKQGVLRYQGAIDSVRSAKQEDIEGAANYVAAALDELLAGKAVTTKETKPYGCSMKFAPEEKKDDGKKDESRPESRNPGRKGDS